MQMQISVGMHATVKDATNAQVPHREASSASSSSSPPSPSNPSSDSTIFLSRVRDSNVRCLLLFVIPAAICIRFLLSYSLHSHSWHEIASARLEVTNNLISFRAIRESIANMQRPPAFGGPISPYAGLSCSRAPPLVIWVWANILQLPFNAAEGAHGSAAFFEAQHLTLLAFFTMVDLITAWCIFIVCDESSLRPSAYIPTAVYDSLRVSLARSPLLAAAFFLLNPFTVISCVIFNGSVIGQLVLAAMLFLAIRGKPMSTMMLLAIATYTDLYPIIIAIPTMMILHRHRYASNQREYQQYSLSMHIDPLLTRFVSPDDLSDSDRGLHDFNTHRVLKIKYQPISLPEDIDTAEALSLKSGAPPSAGRIALAALDRAIAARETKAKWNIQFFIACATVFASTIVMLVYLSWHLSGESFSFLDDSYGFSLRLTSLNPTYSIFWYFFTSIFDRFHTFFLVLFHAHILVYLYPLMVRFASEPIFLVSVLIHMMTLFKPYPTVTELMFTGTILIAVNMPLMMPMIRRIYPVLFLSLVSLLTLMLMQYLWLESGSGNANFFFFQNLIYLFTQLFILMECIGSVRRLQASVMEGRVQETTDQRRECIATAAAHTQPGTPTGQTKKTQ